MLLCAYRYRVKKRASKLSFLWCVRGGSISQLFSKGNGITSNSSSEWRRSRNFKIRRLSNTRLRFLTSIKESSVRCYIVRDCRPLNADGNTFCLTTQISESEDHLWRSKCNTFSISWRVTEYTSRRQCMCWSVSIS